MITVLLDDGGRRAPLVDLERAVIATCSSQGAEEGEVSVALLDDDAIEHLNRVHLGHEGPTDVLAFALYEDGEPVLGDVYVGVDQAARQAADAGVTLDEELVRLVVHGTLHVLGLDHPEDADARVQSLMYQIQESLVAQITRGAR